MADKRSTTVYFISTECYPIAKVGGLGDVTGALPKYLEANVVVVLPKYDLPWFQGKKYKVVYEGSIIQGGIRRLYKICEVGGHDLGYPFYVVDIPGLLDRDGVYADSEGHFFEDEAERYTAFQIAFLDWVDSKKELPSVIHCQDHHTGLVPFMMHYCTKYKRLSEVGTMFTIHNERYQGAFAWEKQYLLPSFDPWKSGMIDWDHRINPLAAGIKCADVVSTVSPSYMEELKTDGAGLEWLFNEETDKLYGILNGIDTQLWDPKTDTYLDIKLKRSLPKFKRENKAALLKGSKLAKDKPLVGFIGRFAVEKGADFLPGIIDIMMSQGYDVNFIILGTGDKSIESNVAKVADLYPENVIAHLKYDEALAHQIYAGMDFILMPSRVEPCGLNQMYALRYGTLPLVHNIGGLKDSIVDMNEAEGYGIKFNSLFIMDIISAIIRGIDVYNDQSQYDALSKRASQLDFSWERAAKHYLELYNKVKTKNTTI